MAVTTIGQLIESIRLLFPEGRVPKNLKTAGFFVVPKGSS